MEKVLLLDYSSDLTALFLIRRKMLHYIPSPDPLRL